MPSTTAEQKKQLRKSVRSLLTTLSPEERTAGDRAMFQAFLSLPEVRQTGTFFLFWGHRRPGAGHRLSGRLADQAGEDGLSAPGSPRLRDGVPGLPPGAAHGHLRLRHPGAHGAGPSDPP